MGYEINLGNGEWATGQGGMAMTVTDTDTGVKEAILMGCDRNAPKTAVNKDGLLYDVLPYEPSVTYVDGVGVLNNEPQATYLSRYSNTLTSWNNQGNSIVENGVYENGLKIFDVSMSGANTAINNTTTASLNDVVSWITLVKGVAGETIQVGVYPSNGISHTFNGEWETIEVEGHTLTSNVSQFQFNTFSLATARNFSVVSVQVTNTITNQSYLDTQDVTITRLADTGFQTPDISKWIDSESFSFEFSCSLLIEGITQRVSLFNKSNGANNRIEFIFSSATDTIRCYVIGNGSIYLNNVNITTSLDRTLENKYRVDLISGVLYFYINDVLEYTSSGGVVFDNLGSLALENYNSTTPLYVHVKNIKIES